MLPKGQVRPRASIPWSQVGSTWSVRQDSDVTGTGPVSQTAYLVNPLGGRYTLGTMSKGSFFTGFSGDARRVVYTTPGSDGRTTVTTWDLSTGGRTSFRTSTAQLDSAQFTEPSGQELLVQQRIGDRTVTSRMRFDGTIVVTYPRTIPGTATPLGQRTDTLDGLLHVFDTTKGLAVVANDGRYVSTLPFPAGMGGCTVTTAWAGSRVAASCYAKGSLENRDTTANVWVYDLSTGRHQQLTHKTDTGGFGYAKAWDTSPVTLLQHVSGCGPGVVDVQSASGTKALTLPSFRDINVVQASGEKAILSSQSCEGVTTYATYNLRTKVLTALPSGLTTGNWIADFPS